ncbi:MAG: hypothetical protein IPP15_22115 [Saprospiraceae bacterium]|uniref:Peptidyl-prolyl cis-trans isomerase n=1 Tax=Candidatus Opimibacter skivensis TaxID=2982028 RepID=A0A9D7SZ94_9BACT|nr:hypothetical protein [Candidatus Opimibacter skivensis]
MHRIIGLNISVLGCVIVAFLMFSCAKAKAPEKKIPDPVILAQVFQYKLTFDDIKDLIQGYSTAEDSMQQVRSLAEHWVRDRLLLVEAEKNFPKEVNMNKLLEDYRQSLVMHFFEQQVIEERLDTVITENDLQRYYEANKEQHRLESGILRGFYFKIKTPLNRNDKILQWWRTFPTNHFEEVLSYMAKHAKTNWADSSEWQEMNMLVQLFPEGTLSPAGIRSNRSVAREDHDYIYLLYPTEVYYERDIAPLSRIRTQAAKYIIHQRELELLERIKKEIYDRDIQLDQVKINTE